ncbi:unnamed protein product [Amoebophrya sp. A25]|nr:unnamed protein product [Amoebophrya sp. A25]|eukprot:GSA25T00009190001.1
MSDAGSDTPSSPEAASSRLAEKRREILARKAAYNNNSSSSTPPIEGKNGASSSGAATAAPVAMPPPTSGSFEQAIPMPLPSGMGTAATNTSSASGGSATGEQAPPMPMPGASGQPMPMPVPPSMSQPPTMSQPPPMSQLPHPPSASFSEGQAMPMPQPPSTSGTSSEAKNISGYNSSSASASIGSANPTTAGPSSSSSTAKEMKSRQVPQSVHFAEDASGKSGGGAPTSQARGTQQGIPSAGVPTGMPGVFAGTAPATSSGSLPLFFNNTYYMPMEAPGAAVPSAAGPGGAATQNTLGGSAPGPGLGLPLHQHVQQVEPQLAPLGGVGGPPPSMMSRLLPPNATSQLFNAVPSTDPLIHPVFRGDRSPEKRVIRSPTHNPASPFREAALGSNPTKGMVICYQRLMSLSEIEAQHVIERYFRDRPEVKNRLEVGIDIVESFFSERLSALEESWKAHIDQALDQRDTKLLKTLISRSRSSSATIAPTNGVSRSVTHMGDQQHQTPNLMSTSMTTMPGGGAFFAPSPAGPPLKQRTDPSQPVEVQSLTAEVAALQKQVKALLAAQQRTSTDLATAPAASEDLLTITTARAKPPRAPKTTSGGQLTAKLSASSSSFTTPMLTTPKNGQHHGGGSTPGSALKVSLSTTNPFFGI